MKLYMNLSSVESYRQFLAVKRLPKYRIRGRVAWFPDEYAEQVGVKVKHRKPVKYDPHPAMFDYQADIGRMAVEKKRYALFADCGLGKTLVFLDFARHAARSLPAGRCVLIVSPLMVIPQTIAECQRFYGGDMHLEHLHAANLQEWLTSGESQIGIVNYEALRGDIRPGRLGALILDESSLLKSHYGKYGRKAIELGRGLHWKMANTGTPAPNDRIEYANHAIFLDQFPTVNAFLARYFVNRGQTDNRWELKPHALEPFYRSLSHWAIFLTNPATYGWKDNCESVPPIKIHYHHVPLTQDQERLVYRASGELFARKPGGITSRAAWGSIAKGWYRGKPVSTNKPAEILRLVDSWKHEESAIIWCIYNAEQDIIARVFPDAANITGETPLEDRLRLIDDFKAGRRRTMISKAKILGFGLNLQVATRQVFSGLQDSYEGFYQAVKRSNRYGSTRPLNVHIPLTDIEEPMVSNVMRKAKLVQHDTEEQERIFKECSYGYSNGIAGKSRTDNGNGVR